MMYGIEVWTAWLYWKERRQHRDERAEERHTDGSLSAESSQEIDFDFFNRIDGIDDLFRDGPR